MAAELKIPSLGESISEVQIGPWLKNKGDYAAHDDPIVEIESEKATVELVAPISGIITKVLKKAGDLAKVGEVIGYMEESKAPIAKPKEATKKEAPSEEAKVMPAARRALAETGVALEDVSPSGPGGRVLKEDVHRAATAVPPAAPDASAPAAPRGAREEESVPMSPMRRAIATHLLEAQQNAALLTTINEVDMSEVMKLRARYKEIYQKSHGIKLGFMSFFVKAVVEGLKLVPEINARIQDTNIMYRNYCDIAIAVGGPKGLVTPVLRNAECMSFADIEKNIADFGARAQTGKISMEELQGGTFTISNGGVYGSLLSTPIVNAPQSGILGMHAIQERPMAVNGEVVIRPMMYLAVTYDHRIVDGKGAVTFLKRVKECVENPARILLEI
jgi:2-oxoglutarate dehydrogenase E2 component (dihydrolipoamide succinyltransferase)